MKLDPIRAVRALALLAWAAFFDWLWLSGGAPTFVGPRTAWVVPFGAIVLTLAALAYAVGVRRAPRGPRPSPRELLGILALITPILAVLAVPNPSLGALAVEQKKSSRAPIAPPSESVENTVDLAASSPDRALLSVSLADSDPQYANIYGVYDGVRVEIVGLVSQQAVGPRAPFEVARFMASCCAADAIPYSVRIRPGPSLDPRTYPRDTWLSVSGVVRREPGRGFVVEADRAEPRRKPADPYLSMGS